MKVYSRRIGESATMAGFVWTRKSEGPRNDERVNANGNSNESVLGPARTLKL